MVVPAAESCGPRACGCLIGAGEWRAARRQQESTARLATTEEVTWSVGGVVGSHPQIWPHISKGAELRAPAGCA